MEERNSHRSISDRIIKNNDISVVNDKMQQDNNNLKPNNDNYSHLPLYNFGNATENKNFNVATNLFTDNVATNSVTTNNVATSLDTNTVVNSNSVYISSSATNSDGFVSNNTIEDANHNQPSTSCIVNFATQSVTHVVSRGNFNERISLMAKGRLTPLSGAVAEKKRKIEIIAQQFFFLKKYKLT